VVELAVFRDVDLGRAMFWGGGVVVGGFHGTVWLKARVCVHVGGGRSVTIVVDPQVRGVGWELTLSVEQVRLLCDLPAGGGVTGQASGV
jgi:hypothetical protein